MTEDHTLREIAERRYVPRTVVCPLDLEEEENLAGLGAALSMAAGTDAAVHVIHVLHTPPPAPVRPGQRVLPDLDAQWEAAREAAATTLDRILAAEEGTAEVPVVREVLVGTDYREIAAYAERVGADLIALVSRGRHGLAEKMLGSVAERVIRLASCPVLSVGPGESAPFTPRNVLVATDFSDCADAALPAVRHLVERFDARVTLAHVLPPQSHPGMISDTGAPPMMTDDYMAGIREAASEELQARAALFEAGGVIDTVVAEARDPGREIVALADREETDLIVVGTRGQSGLERLLLGSTAEKIVRHTDRAVLSVTPELVDDEATREAGSVKTTRA